MTLHSTVLDFLGCPRQEPSPAYLDALLDAYTRRVPWESAFRIARRTATPQTDDCPRWPEIFWADTIHRGGGGTCFESNYAFFDLLRGLGFSGYLTLNDMGESVGCHTAVVVEFPGEKRLADVGYPLYRSLCLDPGQATACPTQFHTFTAAPLGADRYEIRRDRHPKPYVFTLIDQPVADPAYRRATAQDYQPDGHFNYEIIIHKILTDDSGKDRIWRFNGRAEPPLLESFPADPQDKASQEILPPADAPARLASLFAMDRAVLEMAFAALAVRPAGDGRS